MTLEVTEALLDSVLQQIAANPGTTAICNLAGERQLNLLAVRELRRRGLISGVFMDDSTEPGDHHGRFLLDAARLKQV
ncbi:hypothetical protein [Pseudomonas xionganensis]|uniref:Uncharacterized protein n=1 Tax=Pseudomonas xionganensis TaxID=2654845 RepID=A0A6I4KS63_9PSED|nr:hypothetical protein [Pseudomonas xionganensis]MVW75370.1 hypothetical protein [Pseudomonas xionganensis]